MGEGGREDRGRRRTERGGGMEEEEDGGEGSHYKGPGNQRIN